MHEEDPHRFSFGIPAIIYDGEMPDWEIVLKELAENLHRLDLTTEQRAAHELNYVAEGKRHKLFRAAKRIGNNADNAAENHPHAMRDSSRLTAMQAVTRLSGGSMSGVTSRINRATKKAGAKPVSLETSSADDLDAAATAIRAKAPEIKADKTKNRSAGQSARPEKLPAKF